MLIVALVLAVIGLAALVTAVVTSNELIAWVCIAASVLGVILLIVDAIRERQRGPAVAEDADPQTVEETAAPGDAIDATYQTFDADYPADADPVQAIDEDIEVTEVELEPAEAVADDAGEAKPTSG